MDVVGLMAQEEALVAFRRKVRGIDEKLRRQDELPIPTGLSR